MEEEGKGERGLLFLYSLQQTPIRLHDGAVTIECAEVSAGCAAIIPRATDGRKRVERESLKLQ